MKSFTGIISDKLKAAFVKCGYEEKYGQVTVSNRPDLCQYQCNGSLAAAKQYKKAPIMIANEISAELCNDKFFKSVEAVMPGFLNINVAEASIASFVQSMSEEDKLGFEPLHLGETAVVDYGGANVAKPLHVGHLRPAIIGEAVKRIFAFDGFNTIGDAHLGDWGLPIGLVITEIKKRFPDLPYFDETFTGEYPDSIPITVSDLEEIYPYASAYSKEHEDYKDEARQNTALLQSGVRGYRALWQYILKISKEDLKKNYDNLNVFFELWNGESDVNDLIMPMIEDMKSKGITRISEGATVIDVKLDSDNKEMPPCMLLKSDGAAIYASTDLATLVQRERDFKPSKVVYVVDKRQGLHFEQVFRAARKAGIVRDETELFFLGNGTMNSPEGGPFKTRDGGVLRLEFLIKDVADKVLVKMADREMPAKEAEEVAKKVGLAALKYGDLSNQATKDYVFDIERFTSFEGNTGPYILYTMVRIKSILEKYAQLENIAVDDVYKKMQEKNIVICKDNDCTLNLSDSELKLMLSLTDYAEAIRHASDDKAPHKICSYMFEVSDAFNSFYHENKIIAETDATVRDRWIALSIVVLKSLKYCTDLLGIDVPDRM